MDYSSKQGKELIEKASWTPRFPGGEQAITDAFIQWELKGNCYVLPTKEGVSVITPVLYIKQADLKPEVKKYATMTLVLPFKGNETPDQIAFVRWMNETLLGAPRTERAKKIRCDPIEIAFEGCWIKGSYGSQWELRLSWKAADFPHGIPIGDIQGNPLDHSALRAGVPVSIILNVSSVWNNPSAVAQVAFCLPSFIQVISTTPVGLAPPKFDVQMFGQRVIA